MSVVMTAAGGGLPLARIHALRGIRTSNMHQPLARIHALRGIRTSNMHQRLGMSRKDARSRAPRTVKATEGEVHLMAPGRASKIAPALSPDR